MEAQENAQTETVNVARKTVLIVDDVADQRAVYRDLFTHLGYQVLEGADGWECLQTLSCCAPDLVILDLALPIISGWAVAEEMREWKRTAGIPIIAMTGLTGPHNEKRADDIGIDLYLEKPIDPHAMARAVLRLTTAADGSLDAVSHVAPAEGSEAA